MKKKLRLNAKSVANKLYMYIFKKQIWGNKYLLGCMQNCLYISHNQVIVTKCIMLLSNLRFFNLKKRSYTAQNNYHDYFFFALRKMSMHVHYGARQFISLTARLFDNPLNTINNYNAVIRIINLNWTHVNVRRGEV